MKSELKSLDFADVEKMRALSDHMLAQAKAKGADQAEVGVSASVGLSVNVRLGEVESVEYNREKGAAVTLYVGKAKGHASTSDTSPESLSNLIDHALAIAKQTHADDCAGIPDQADLATEQRELDLYHPWDIDAERAIEIAKDCEASALARDARIKNSDGASVDTMRSYFVVGNSHGFYGGYPTSRQSLSCLVIANDGDDMERDYDYTTARSASDLLEGRVVGERAADRALARLGGRSVKTGKFPVLFRADLARSLFGHMIGAASGGNLYRKASFLLDKRGERIFPQGFEITEDPFVPRGLGSSPFDQEGVRVASRKVIDDGVLQDYFLSSYSARKLGMKTTGNAGGAHNIFVDYRGLSFEALLKEMGTGLLVTELMSRGANMVTGDYSRGASGLWVENGEIQFPVKEITIAGNLKDIYQSIVAVGNDVDTRGALQTGSVLVSSMTVGGG